MFYILYFLIYFVIIFGNQAFVTETEDMGDIATFIHGIT